METQVLDKPQVMDLSVINTGNIRNELALANPTEIQLDMSRLQAPTLKLADNLIANVMSYDPKNPAQVDLQSNTRTAIEGMGEKAMVQAAQAANSPMLKKSIAMLAKTEDGGPVAKDLLALNSQVMDLDPSKIDFSQEGGIKRLMGSIFGSKIRDYFTKFEQADAVIGQIVQSLINGRNELSRDNGMLSISQQSMRANTFQLEETIMLGLYLDQKFHHLVEFELADDDPRKKFIGEEILFLLRQRITDLQQQLAVNQQGVLVYEMIIRNNKELIKGVKRAEMVTVTALNIAVAAAMALGNQKLVLKTLGAINETTNNLIAGTAARLKTQGAEIHKQASGAMLDIEVLKKAFEDVKSTLDDISAYRLNALDAMRQNIDKMNGLNKKASEAIAKMEEGDRMAPQISLEVPAAN